MVSNKALIYGILTLTIFSYVIADDPWYNPMFTVVPCNFATEPAFSCRDCGQTLICLINNVGYMRNCTGTAPYCRNGFCSRTPGPGC